MDTRLSSLEAAVLELRSIVADLDRRLAAIEARGTLNASASHVAGAPAADAIPVPATAAAGQTDMVVVLSLVGRSVIVLGGAYLLRAFTEAGVLPPRAGALAGLAYAVAWVAAAGRAAGRNRAVDGGFHGLTAAIIGYPLIFEATAGFAFFTPLASAATLGAFTALALLVAWHWRQQALAWIATVASLATAVALVPATGAPVPYAVFLIALGVGTLWLGYVCDWTVLRWPVGLVASGVAAGLVGRALTVPPRESPGVVVTVLLLLVGGYLASTAIRTLWRGRNVVAFEVCQTAVALLIGLGGAAWILSAAPAGHAWFGVAVTGLGAVSYMVAFAFVDRRQGRGRNFHFYTSLAVAFTLVGGGLLLGTAVLPWFAVLIGAANAWLGVRFDQLALRLHAVVYVGVAAAVAGTLGDSGASLTGVNGGLPPWPGAVALAATGAAVLALVITPGRAPAADGAWSRVPPIVMLTLALWIGGGSLVAALVHLLAAANPPALAAADALGATVRTSVLSLSALGLAAICGDQRVREAAWYVYPLLLVTGAKIIAVDIRTSRPSLLVIALAAYGAALIVAPRLMRRGR